MQRSWRAITAGEIRLALIAALLSTTAFAAWPLPPDAPPADYADAGNWPNDPAYGESYWEFSFKPAGVTAAEPSVGNSFDRAWSVTRGSPSTVIAIIGAKFSFDERDLVNRWALSPGELPVPQDAQGNAGTSHDRNGDGRFNAQDFTSATGTTLPTPLNVVDPRLANRADKGDVNGNGIIDPADLLTIFGNGVDDDGNGAIDDVCGFDVESGSGDVSGREGLDQTRLALLTAAEGNNALGGIGACPDCAVLPIRVSDSDVADPLRVAEAIRLAGVSGAKVIIVGVQTFGPSWRLNDAAAMSVAVVIGGPAPRPGLRTDFPTDEGALLRADALGPSSSDWRSASSFSALHPGCGETTSWTGSLVAPDCESAPALFGGAAGLLVSRASAFGISVDVAALLGAHRLDVRAALDALQAGSIPNRISLGLPVHRPTGPFQVSAHLGETALTTVTFEASPDFPPSALQEFHREQTGDVNVSATVDPAAFNFSSPTLQSHPFGSALTIRARSESPDGGAAEAVAQGVVFLGSDPALLPSFPLPMGDGNFVRLVDVDGDGSDEFIVTAAEGVGVLDATGAELPGFPVAYDAGSVVAPAAIGDLDGDGRSELVLITTSGKLVVLDSHGAPYKAFPVQLSGPAVAAPVISSAPTGVILVVADLSGRVHVLSSNGAELQGSPVELGRPIVATPAVGDVDNDGWPEIVVGTTASTNELTLLRVRDTGVTKDGAWPRAMPGDGGSAEALYSTGVVASPLIANIDRDGEREIIARAAGGPLQVLRSDGTPLLKLDQSSAQRQPVSAAIWDVNGDGLWELADVEASGTLNAWSAGEELRSALGKPSLGSTAQVSGFPVSLADAPVLSGFAVADVDGDGVPELLFGGDRPLIYAVNAAGVVPPGWPKQVPCGVQGNVAVGMMNNHLVVAALSRCGELYAWSVTGVPENIQWDGFHHDPQNTGSTSTPLPKRKLQGIGIDNPPGPVKGCCSGAPGTIDISGVALIALAVLGKLTRRRK